MPKGDGAKSSKMLGKAIETDLEAIVKKKVVNTESGNAVATAKEEVVNITIKVPRSHRQHWQIEAKRDGETMTSVITKSLTKKFGRLRSP